MLNYKSAKKIYSHHKFKDINKIKTPTDLSNLSLKYIRTLFNNLINNEKTKVLYNEIKTDI